MATHYSVSDWDLKGDWILDNSTYVSSPSSIRIPDYSGATCKRSEVWNLPQGMIISYAKMAYDWNYGSYYYGPAFSFRNQATSGHGLSGYGWAAVGYAVVINGYNKTALLARDNSTIATLSLLAYPAHINAWNKYRVTWWSDTGGGGLLVRLEYWDGSNWVKMINDWNDTTDKYKDSTVNRVSVGSYHHYYAWFDDTEIWGV